MWPGLAISAVRIFQSTPPARGATLDGDVISCPLTISIHAPREGGDDPKLADKLALNISIHAPREGGD